MHARASWARHVDPAAGKARQKQGQCETHPIRHPGIHLCTTAATMAALLLSTSADDFPRDMMMALVALPKPSVALLEALVKSLGQLSPYDNAGGASDGLSVQDTGRDELLLTAASCAHHAVEVASLFSRTIPPHTTPHHPTPLHTVATIRRSPARWSGRRPQQSKP